MKGDEIPLSARIVGITDVYDALRSERVYKKPLPHQKTADEINRSSGSHFDPKLVEIFLEIEKVFE